PPGMYKGSSASFNVWAEGSPTLKYQWTSNGVVLPVPDTTTNITLNNLSAGSLAVAAIVTNAYGAITSSVSTIVVASKPLILTQPVPVTRFTGVPFSVSVVAGGTQPISYQWKTNGTAIPGANSSTFSATMSPATAGSYSCTLSNEAGTSNSI